MVGGGSGGDDSSIDQVSTSGLCGAFTDKHWSPSGEMVKTDVKITAVGETP